MKKYYSFDIETNEKTGALYLWCLCECSNFNKLVENPKSYEVKNILCGTKWGKFFKWLDQIEKGSVIFIHNMEFDFNGILANCPNFASRYNLDNEKSIITGFHSFIKIACENFIILDSAKITMLSIYGIGELLGIPKLEETYNGIVTEQSIKYCYRDCELSLRGVAYFCNAYGIKNVPLTSTGYNKKTINKQVSKKSKYIAIYNNEDLKDTQNAYNKFDELVRKEFNGGVCYANMCHSGKIHKAGACDIGSSYPTAMMGYLYPYVTKSTLQPFTSNFKALVLDTFKNIPPEKIFACGSLCAVLGNKYAHSGFLCKVVINGSCKLHIFQNKNYFPLVSMTKRRKSKGHNISGLHVERFDKVKTAFNKLLYLEEGDRLELACNEYDLYMLLHCYDIENIDIEYGYIYQMKPNPFLCEIVKTFLQDKNSCKNHETDIDKWNNKAFYNLFEMSETNNDEQLYNFVYQRTKGCVNGTYGINVEDHQKEHFSFVNDKIEKTETEDHNGKSPYNELIGSYVSTYGRWQLFCGFIGVVINGGINYYSDTDSLKVGKCEVQKVVDFYNTQFSKHWEKLESVFKDFERPTKYGIGELDIEKVNGCEVFDFVSIGSKSYLTHANGKIKSTISGVRNSSKIFNNLLQKEKTFHKVVKKYYHYGLIIKNNKLVPDYTKLGEPCENGNTCVVLRYSDFSMMNSNTGKLNKAVLENVFNNISPLYDINETIIEGNI